LQSKFQPPVSKLSSLDEKEQKIIETVKEKVHIVATENKQLKRSLDLSNREIDQLNYEVKKNGELLLYCNQSLRKYSIKA
jgi:hypothetical protein